MKNLKTIGCGLLAALTLGFTTSCSDDDNSGEMSGTGSATFEVADAPIDNAEVSGVFVTITNVEVNGETVDSFNGPITVDLLALQKGKTEVLATDDLNAGTYNDITFTLDLATDEDGNSPGSYVMTTSGKQALELNGEEKVELVASGSYDIMANSTQNIVVDFDLRKMIKEEDNGAMESDKYTLVSKSEASAALRLVTKQEAGNIMGSVDMSGFEGADKVIVYAYKKGEFDADAEAQGQGESNIKFAHAVSSAVVDGSLTGSGSFQLSYMEKGDYELVYAAYNENEFTSELDFSALIKSSLSAEGEMGDEVSVSANANVNISLSLTSLFD